MKKIITLLAMMIIMTSSVFAGKERPGDEILDSFNNKFSGVKDITWVTAGKYYKAAFTYNGSRMFACYSAGGELLGVIRYISPAQLPYYLQDRLKQKSNGYWIANLVELSTGNGFSYYIVLQNADKRIVLKSGNGNNWKTYNSKKQNFKNIQEYLD